MSLFGKILKGIGGSILGNVAGGVANQIFAPSSVNGYVDFVNTPQTLADAMKNVTPAYPGAINGFMDDIFSNAGNLLSPAVVGGPNYTNLGITQPADPVYGVNDYYNDLTAPYKAVNTNLLNTPGSIAPSGINFPDFSSLFPPQQPQTVQNVQGQQPFVNGNAPLINTPGTIVPPGNTITPYNPTGLPTTPDAKSPFDLNDFLKTITSAGLLGGQLFGDNGLPGEADDLRKLAGDLGNRGNSILDTAIANQQGLINGQALNGIERRVKQAEAGIRHNYAEMGMSGSSMEAQDLAGLQERAAQETFNIGKDMATTGLVTASQMLGQQSNIYTQLMNAQIAQDESIRKAISAFAAAAAK